MGLIALGVGVGLGIAAYRNLPSMTDRALSVVLVVWVVSVAAAWFGSRRHAQQQWQMQMQDQAQDQAQEQRQQQIVVVNTRGDHRPAIAGGVAGVLEEVARQSSQEALTASESQALASGSGVPLVASLRSGEAVRGSGTPAEARRQGRPEAVVGDDRQTLDGEEGRARGSPDPP